MINRVDPGKLINLARTISAISGDVSFILNQFLPKLRQSEVPGPLRNVTGIVPRCDEILNVAELPFRSGVARPIKLERIKSSLVTIHV
jgi:hypothetical protein